LTFTQYLNTREYWQYLNTQYSSLPSLVVFAAAVTVLNIPLL